MDIISTVYHSGFGHTQKQAEAVHEALSSIEGLEANLLALSPEGELSEAEWEQLDGSDAIIFGSPTYMGMVSWQFKKFVDASSKRWASQTWKDKIAAGFTNSASMNGDKLSTLHYMFTSAMQHSMVWVGTGMMPANSKAAEGNDINYLASFSGLMAQSPYDASPEDLETAKLFAQRVAELTKRWNS